MADGALAQGRCLVQTGLPAGGQGLAMDPIQSSKVPPQPISPPKAIRKGRKFGAQG